MSAFEDSFDHFIRSNEDMNRHRFSERPKFFGGKGSRCSLSESPISNGTLRPFITYTFDQFSGPQKPKEKASGL
jgi:hypothetical protein